MKLDYNCNNQLDLERITYETAKEIVNWNQQCYKRCFWGLEKIEYDYNHSGIADDEYCYYRVYNIKLTRLSQFIRHTENGMIYFGLIKQHKTFHFIVYSVNTPAASSGVSILIIGLEME